MRSILLSCALALSGTATAATHTVCSNGCDFQSIQGAIDSAGNNDLIQITDGGRYEEKLFIDNGKATGLTIEGISTEDHPVIGNGSDPDLEVDNNQATFRRLEIVSDNAKRGAKVKNSASVVVFEDMIFGVRTGTADGMGFRQEDNSTVTIRNSTFNASATSSAKRGGCIDVDGDNAYAADLILENVDFGACDAGTTGGAINIKDNAILTMTGGSITGAGATSGGAIYGGPDTQLNIDGTTFTSNTASGSGGAVYYVPGGNHDNDTLTIDNATFDGNTSTSSGGAIYSNAGKTYVRDSILDGNSASRGAIRMSGTDVLELRRNIFCGNTNTGTDGGVAVSMSGAGTASQTFPITNNLFALNTATGTGSNGGAIYLNSSTAGTFSIVNNTFLSDSTQTGGQHIDANGADTVNLNNLFAFTSGGHAVDYHNAATNHSFGYNAWWQNSGGNIIFGATEPTLDSTHVVTDPTISYTSGVTTCANLEGWALAGSPLVDAGDPSLFDDLAGTDRSDIGYTGGTEADPNLRDGDGDGVVAAVDCDDTDPNVYPGASELCNGEDDNCNGQTDEGDIGGATWYLDDDNDGFGAITATAIDSCLEPTDGRDYSQANTDCDDTTALRAPGLSEVCEVGDLSAQIDNDCVDDATNGLTFTDYYVDGDQDGNGAGTAASYCQAPVGDYSTTGTDCDDNDGTRFVGNPEVCEAGLPITGQLDNDCVGDGTNGLAFTSYYVDGDLDTIGAGTAGLYCDNPGSGFSTRNDDCDDADALNFPGNTETCETGPLASQVDNDCVGGATNTLTFTDYFVDGDVDGVGSGTAVSYCYDPGTPFVDEGGDCDDSDPLNFPGNTESCESGPIASQVDNDCVGDGTNDLTFINYWVDGDRDTYGAGTPDQYCQDPGVGFSTVGTDCDDTKTLYFPGADEYCEGDDNDCDGTIDEDAVDSLTWYADTDDDLFGDPNSFQVICAQPADHVLDNTDCDDVRPDVNPDADEYCDGTTDEDCDGSIDEDTAADAGTWYEDGDNDDFGDPNSSQNACVAPSGYVADNTDCDDGRNSVNPDADETCNNRDNDCNGIEDDGWVASGGQVYFEDLDQDGFGNPDVTGRACSEQPGFVTIDGDCNDNVFAINPDATETCGDGVDANCDGAGGPQDDDDNDGIPYEDEITICVAVENNGDCNLTFDCASDCNTDS
ncbi:MAG: hypothetical protein KC912_25995, partial [Proteobacteria bacterium]|nr:hypothetical protein [Pseudomonadota bacterium]